MTKERRLGRGLEALLGRPADAPAGHGSASHQPAPHLRLAEPAAGGPGLLEVSVYEIDSNPYQPRTDFDAAEIDKLAESIREHGILQPLVVRRADERYQLIAGERRLRAAIKAGLPEVPVQVREADDQQMAELAIVENLQRKDLNPLEKATSFRQYLDRYGCTQEELAGRLKIDRSTIANLIRLLELPEVVQAALRGGTLTQGHARALLPLGDEEEQIAFAQRVQSEGLSVRATEALVQETIRAADEDHRLGIVSPGDREARPRSGQLTALEQEFRAALGTKVDVRQTSAGRGRIVIHFKNHAEFDRLRDYLNGPEGTRRVG